MSTNWHCGRFFFFTLVVFALTSTSALAGPPEVVPPICPSQASIVMKSGSGNVSTQYFTTIPFVYDEMRHVSVSISVYNIWHGNDPWETDQVQVQFDYLDESGNVVAGSLVTTLNEMGGQFAAVEFDAKNWKIVIAPFTDRPSGDFDIVVAYNYTTTHSTTK